MEKSHNTGGPAFPSDSGVNFKSGMTLRDYFAGRVLPILYMGGWVGKDQNELDEQMSKAAYRIADAMMQAR